MSQNNNRPLSKREVLLEPLELSGRNICVGPVKITVIVIDSCGRVIGVEDHEVQAVDIEGVIGQVGRYVCVFNVG